MPDQPKENGGMSKDMANETITLTDLYERVVKVCPAMGPPQVAIVGGKFQLAIECVDRAHCATWTRATDASMPAIESLILAACVRWLADNGFETTVYPQCESDLYVIHVDECGEDAFAGYYKSSNLTLAALLAVEAVCKERCHA